MSPVPRFFRRMPVVRILGRATDALYVQFSACCLCMNDAVYQVVPATDAAAPPEPLRIKPPVKFRTVNTAPST